MAKAADFVVASAKQSRVVPWEHAASETGLRHLLTNQFLPVVVHDGGLIIEATHGVLFLFRYPIREILWTQLAELVTASSLPVLDRYLRLEANGPIRLEGLRKDGFSFPCEFATRTTLLFRGRRVQVSTWCDLSCEPEPSRKNDGARARDLAGARA